VRDATFSISTYLFHRERLDREHLVDIAAHGFEGLELFALPSHFDCADAAGVELLAEWLDDTRLSLRSVHAPVAEGHDGSGWVRPCSLASLDPAARERALTLATQALGLAKRLKYQYLVVRIGAPDQQAGPSDNDAGAARRSLDVLVPRAEDSGVQLALEVFPNRLSTPEALVTLVEEVLPTHAAGLCVDIGQARMLGDPVDAIESASGHILTAHVHDTHGARVEHLVPFEGSIDWARTLLAFQKVGFQGPWTFELAPTATPLATLAAAAHARARFEQRLGINDELLSQ
jgi:sugar phosphate isomerase/epimerase